MSSTIVDDITKKPIQAKITDIRKNIESFPKEKLVERINKVTMELTMLQYRLREYATYEWYQKLNDLQKAMHDFYEEHYDEIKLFSRGNNWVVISDREITESSVLNKRDMDGFWFAYIPTMENVKSLIKEYTDDELEHLLFSPIFDVTK